MTKQQIFTTAHEASKEMNNTFSYRTRFSCALKGAWKLAKELSIIEIRKITLWEKNDARLYVDYKFKGEVKNGCLYLDGNSWNKKGSSNIPASILEKVIEICNKVKGCDYATVYGNEINISTQKSTVRRFRTRADENDYAEELAEIEYA